MVELDGVERLDAPNELVDGLPDEDDVSLIDLADGGLDPFEYRSGVAHSMNAGDGEHHLVLRGVVPGSLQIVKP